MSWNRFKWFFNGSATALVDLLFIELMLHLSHVIHMCSQPIHLTHELLLCIQIMGRWVDIHGDSAVKSPCWHQGLNLQPSNPDLLHFAAVPSLRDLAILYFHQPKGFSKTELTTGLVRLFRTCSVSSTLSFCRSSCSAAAAAAATAPIIDLVTFSHFSME